MIDIKILRANPDIVKESLRKRNAEVDLQAILDMDQQVRELKSSVEQKMSERNSTSAKIGKGQLSPEEKQKAIADTKALGEVIKEENARLKELEEKVYQAMLRIPNILHEDTPEGTDEEENLEVRKWGEPKKFDFQPLHHLDLAEKLGIMDAPRGVKISQSRFTLVRKQGALLERALAAFMMDVQTEEHGYEEVLPPFLVNADSLQGTGQLPKFEEDLFKTTDGLYLIPTAEVPLTNVFRDEILPEKQLPIQFVAHTPCFRSEAGSYGKDTKGYIRQHQFNKVELVWFAHPDKSVEAHEALVSHAEKILQKLELPYRTVTLCSGDIGFSATKCYDIEVWIPSEEKYREISSCSNMWDFQARRAGIRFKPSEGGKTQFVHTLNGSGLAVGRTLVAVLENYQQADGSIKVPEVLIPYMKGITEINA
jgi:seryl-tRNA synthetase